MEQPPELPRPPLPPDLEALFPHTADVQGVDALPFYVGMPLDEMIASYAVTQDWLRAHPPEVPVPFWTRHARLRSGLLIAGASVASVGLCAAVVVLVPWGSIGALLTPAPSPAVLEPMSEITILTPGERIAGALMTTFMPALVTLSMVALAIRFILGR